jgi:acetyl-CoA carboxylase carboxyl transferase subunit alpha
LDTRSDGLSVSRIRPYNTRHFVRGERLVVPKTNKKIEHELLVLEERIEQLRKTPGILNAREVRRLEAQAEAMHRKITENLTSWQRVQWARHPQRPLAMDYLKGAFTDFMELHGDRCFGDDPAMVGGFAYLEGRPVMVIGQQRGRETEEKIRRNFGMPHPEGYRKALRLMKLADKFHRPIITLIDTSGAYPGIGAEERGQAEAIARNLFEMARLQVPVVAVVIGEGGSGGALGIGVAHRVLMMENAIYSVISPEGCAAILWDNREMIQQASEVLKLTARDLKAFQIVDGIIPEPIGGAHRRPEAAVEALRRSVAHTLESLRKMSPTALEKTRSEKYRSIGRFAVRKPVLSGGGV